MELRFVGVDGGFAEKERLDALMLQAFPPKEYLPLEKQLELQAKGEVSVWALYDAAQLVGLTTIREYEEMAYLFFLAIGQACRSRGYGKAALDRISERYRDRQLTVDFELADETAENNAQRLRRRDFYLENGFGRTGWGLSYLGVSYELFSRNRPFDIGLYRRMMSGISIEGLDPVYFRL